MTSEMVAQFIFTNCADGRTVAQFTHSLKNELCDRNPLLSFLFSMKQHSSTVKKGGIRDMKKRHKTGQKEQKEREYKEYSGIGKELCAVRPAISGALA